MAAVIIREQSLIVVSIYRPPKGNIDIFSDRLEKAMYWISTNGCVNTCVVGDFNVNFLRRSKNVKVTSDSDAGKAYEKFHSAIHASFNKSFPKVRKRMKTNQRISRVSEASLGLRKAVEAAHTIYRVRRDDNSKEHLGVLKKHLRNSYTDTRKQENAKYIVVSTDKSRAVWRVMKKESGVKHNAGKVA
ncbi:hypothetical protein HHI36_018985 [Cryptolaemus montrouzieri]|uniref:Endonuclease/exonuclease/phosphatase domain-containing protein n=1 Tax=Cryptolaemus montrouzieri TaxID=559131 RepID=A0ABD2P2D9_9CUCU